MKGKGFCRFLVCSALLIFIAVTSLHAKDLSYLKRQDIVVYFNEAHGLAGREVLELYPRVRADLERTVQEKIDFRPTVLLVPDRDTFIKMAGSPLFVAYAVPDKMLIVIDYSRMNIEPFTLSVTLKHELCHLMLHRSIEPARLPRWLDEGFCQWVSDGLSELATPRNSSALALAALSGNFIGFDSLTRDFPEEAQSLALAYEQSSSIVDYIVSEFGKSGLFNIIDAMKNGLDAETAIRISLGMPFEELEKKWQKSQKSWRAAISGLVANIYTILFVLAALLTFAVYLRYIIRKRRLRDEEEE